MAASGLARSTRPRKESRRQAEANISKNGRESVRGILWIMRWVHFSLMALLFASPGLAGAAQDPLSVPAPGHTRFTVFLQGRAIGTEQVSVSRTEEGTVVSGSGSVAPPLDTVTRRYEIRYDTTWQPVESSIDGVIQGEPLSVQTRFEQGTATSQISRGTQVSTKTDQVSPDALVLMNQAVTSYEALAARASSLQPGDRIRGYVVPQAEMPIRLASATTERIQTPAGVIVSRRYHFIFENPSGEVAFELWAEDPSGRLVRVFVPAQRFEVVREDVASVAARRVVLPREGDENVMIPADGFNLAATISRPGNELAVSGRLPAVVLVGGAEPVDRDEIVGGVPIFAQLAGRLADAGFLVVRYDKRAVGQSGGRAERAGIEDYAADVRAVVKYLTKRRDVDKKRIAAIGYAEGGWTALHAASKEKSIAALVLLATPGTPGGDLVLEQQQIAFSRLEMTEEEKRQKADLQRRIHEAVRTGEGWEGIPPELRRQADTAWFHSFLTFDPYEAIRKTKQPLLIVHGEADRRILPHHAELLADKARARKQPAGSAVEVNVVPGVNHLLVPGAGGEDEEASPEERSIDERLTGSVISWLTARFTPPKKR